MVLPRQGGAARRFDKLKALSQSRGSAARALSRSRRTGPVRATQSVILDANWRVAACHSRGEMSALGFTPVDPRRRAFLLLLVIYLGYLSLGLPDGTLGVTWPEMYPELGLPLGLAGTILTLGTVLTGLAAFSSGWIVGRFGTGPVVIVSGGLTATGLVLLSQAQGALWLYAAAVPLGLGAGAVDAALNGYVARHYRSRHMNWLHACWGIGATSGPIFIGWAIAGGHGWRGGYLVLGCIQFALAGLFLLTLRLWSVVPEITPEENRDGVPQAKPTLPAGSLAGWLSPLIFALYVAVEMTIGLWAGTVLVVRRGISPENAALGVAAFYGALTGGRILSGFVVERWGNRRMVDGGAVVAATGLVLFGFTANLPLAAAALMVTGLGLAPIYPGLMQEVPRRFAPEAVQTMIGRQSGGASFGAAVLPALAGLVAQHSLAAVTWLVLGVLVVMIACIRHLNRIS
jgi:fucose permease